MQLLPALIKMARDGSRFNNTQSSASVHSTETNSSDLSSLDDSSLLQSPSRRGRSLPEEVERQLIEDIQESGGIGSGFLAKSSATVKRACTEHLQLCSDRGFRGRLSTGRSILIGTTIDFEHLVSLPAHPRRRSSRTRRGPPFDLLLCQVRVLVSPLLSRAIILLLPPGRISKSFLLDSVN
jgi:hypothetical protein